MNTVAAFERPLHREMPQPCTSGGVQRRHSPVPSRRRRGLRRPARRPRPLLPFGHACEPRNGVLFCPTRTLADRVPSFDSTPLDVDVTLPADVGVALPTAEQSQGGCSRSRR